VSAFARRGAPAVGAIRPIFCTCWSSQRFAMRSFRRKRKPLLSNRPALTIFTRFWPLPNSVTAPTSAPASKSGLSVCRTAFPWQGDRRAECWPSISSHARTIVERREFDRASSHRDLAPVACEIQAVAMGHSMRAGVDQSRNPLDHVAPGTSSTIVSGTPVCGCSRGRNPSRTASRIGSAGPRQHLADEQDFPFDGIGGQMSLPRGR
jgi:hypothetical protein